ncbi:MAG: CoB--CoM heterodisulfide reductase iron-sulfur subunit B family protein [Deltaproteobacteria bacterium]|nr:CoB--CoM heterodisulfide reductase iron-sulfur subunit B family protein [Deltaproteobacteria bacterium]
MIVSYYPGCSLESTASEYDQSLRAVCGEMGIELRELDDWNCCGASSAHCTNEKLSVALPARTLAIAQKHPEDLLVPCVACFSRLRWAEKRIKDGKAPDMEISYAGKVPIRHAVDILGQDEPVEIIKKKIRKPLAGLRLVSYYGCLTVRPPDVTGYSDFENPTDMDRLMEITGAEIIDWPYKTECCGGSLAISRPDLVVQLSGKLLSMVREAGAEAVVVGCPMCHANLDTRQEEISQQIGEEFHVPIFYFTELLGVAMGNPRAGQWLKKHIVDPRRLLANKNLI